MKNSLTYEEALETVISNIHLLDAEEKAPVKAEGQVLAEDIYSDYTLPMRETSGPDGYAVKAEDILKASKENPVILEIIDTVRAGYLSEKTVTTGKAIRIMTGSVVPDGADCVVRFEDTDEPQDKSGPNPNHPTHVKIFVSLTAGTSINKAGGNIKKDALVMTKNTIIGTAQLAALIATGKKTVKVIRRPRVAIITTGDELIKLNKPLTPGKAYDSNETIIQSLVNHYGGIPNVLGIARDDEKSIISKIQSGLAADAIVTTGGVSKGDYDLLRQVISKLGELVFFRIKMGPGAAFAFGLLRKSPNNNSTIPIFALSGPPQGCMVNFETIVRPALLKMRGFQDIAHPTVEAVSEDAIPNARPMSFIRWTLLKRVNGGYTVSQNNADSVLAQISSSNSLTIIPAGVSVKAGDKLQVMPIDWCR